jgi:hypothetical protein
VDSVSPDPKKVKNYLLEETADKMGNSAYDYMLKVILVQSIRDKKLKIALP